MEKSRIIKAIENARTGIEQYLEIMHLFPRTDASKDDDFQRKYNSFYKLRQRPQEFYQIYYGYMEDMKGESVEFQDALNYFHKSLDRVEASFSSKLVATHNPHLPVWDQYVLRNIGIQPPSYNERDRICKVIAVYDQIKGWYQTFMNSEEGQLMISLFDKMVDASDMITDIKKIDFILWQTRTVENKNKTRRPRPVKIEQIDIPVTDGSDLDVVSIIKKKFQEAGSPARISKLRGSDTFKAEIGTGGIYVDNLANQKFLPWQVFKETIKLLIQKGGRAKRGDAMNSKLGDKGLPLNSVEGHVSHIVYGKKIGDSVFRRITPIACILIWAGICRAGRGELILSEQYR